MTTSFQRLLASGILAAALSGFAPAWAADQAEPVDVGQLIADGVRAWEASDVATAEARFSEAAKQAPSSLDAHLKLGGLYLSQQKYKPAVEQFQAAIGLDPDNAKTFVVLGVAYLHAGQTELAREAVAEALVRDPDLEAGKKLAAMLDAASQAGPADAHGSQAKEGRLHDK